MTYGRSAVRSFNPRDISLSLLFPSVPIVSEISGHTRTDDLLVNDGDEHPWGRMRNWEKNDTSRRRYLLETAAGRTVNFYGVPETSLLRVHGDCSDYAALAQRFEEGKWVAQRPAQGVP